MGVTLARPLRRRSLFGRLPVEVLFVCLCVRFGGVCPVAMVRRSIKRVAGGADFIRIKFFWLLSPELRWLGQPGNGNLTVCGVMVDVLGEQLVSGSV